MMAAGMQSHSASYPSEANAPRTSPSPRLSSSATFSSKTNCGRSSPTRRATSAKRPERSPESPRPRPRSEEHTSELQSLMRISYAVFCLKKQKTNYVTTKTEREHHKQQNIN